MKNLKLELIETLEKEEIKRENYKIGVYAVYVYYVRGAFESLEIRSLDRDGYTPDIYFTGTKFGEVRNEFQIQTSSFGALAPEVIPEVIKGYEVAMQVVAILKNAFIEGGF